MLQSFPLTRTHINPIDNTPKNARGGIYRIILCILPNFHPDPMCPSTLLGGARVHRVTARATPLFDRFEHGISAPE